MRLEPVNRVPHAFNASAQALTFGEVYIVEYRFGSAVGSWAREALAASDRVRLVILARSPGASGS
jgi:hypothetical protein